MPGKIHNTNFYTSLNLEKRSYIEGDLIEPKFRNEDTVTTIRKSNLPVDLNKSQEIRLPDVQFRNDLEEKFGVKLLSLLETYFEENIINGEYICNPNNCKLPLLETYPSDDSSDLNDNDSYERLNFSHSFRYSSNASITDQKIQFKNAEDFLTNLMRTKVKMKDLVDYYQGNKSPKNVVNAYLRLLDVYNELIISRSEFTHPNEKQYGIKIFETDLLDEFIQEQNTGIVSNALDEELQDLVDQHLLIIPVAVSLFLF